jgi:adenylate kinase family enzyme
VYLQTDDPVFTEWDIKTVGVGDLLRKEIRKGTPLGGRAEEVMKSGGAPLFLRLHEVVC